MSVPAPTIGRIVLVKSTAFFGECPAIVVMTYKGVQDHCINVRVFTNDDESPTLLCAVPPQGENSLGFGWRWPPREGADLGSGVGSAAAVGEVSGASESCAA